MIRRLNLIIGLASLAIFVAAVGNASAFSLITTSNITAPADGSFMSFNVGDVASGPSTITGTFVGDGSSGALRCTRTLDGGYNDDSVNTVNFAASPFSHTTVGDPGVISHVSQRVPGPCHLRLADSVATLSAGVDAAFAGPIIYVSRHIPLTNVGGKLTGFAISSVQRDGSVDLNTFDQCGLSRMMVSVGDVQSERIFNCDNYLDSGPVAAPAPANTPRMTVDGIAVYGANMSPDNTLPGFLPITYTHTHSTTDGSVTVTDTTPLFACAPSHVFPATGGCTRYDPAGVSLVRRIVTTTAGRRVLFTDDFRSTDGTAHAVSLYTREDLRFADNGVAFPGHDFTEYIAPETVTMTSPGKPGRVLIRRENTSVPAGSLLAPVAAITFGKLPASVLVSGTDSYSPHYVFTVPARGNAEYRRVYTMDTALTSLVAKGAWELDWVSPPSGVKVLGKSSRNIRGVKLPLAVLCPASERTCVGVVTARYAGKKVGGARLATWAGGKQRLATIKLTGKAKARLRAGRKVRLVVTVVATDGAGNTITVPRTITVR